MKVSLTGGPVEEDQKTKTKLSKSSQSGKTLINCTTGMNANRSLKYRDCFNAMSPQKQSEYIANECTKRNLLQRVQFLANLFEIGLVDNISYEANPSLDLRIEALPSGQVILGEARIIESKSPVLAKLINKRRTKGRGIILIQLEGEGKLLQTFIDCISEEPQKLTLEEAKDLLPLSIEYQVEDLEEQCLKVLTPIAKPSKIQYKLSGQSSQHIRNIISGDTTERKNGISSTQNCATDQVVENPQTITMECIMPEPLQHNLGTPHKNHQHAQLEDRCDDDNSIISGCNDEKQYEADDDDRNTSIISSRSSSTLAIDDSFSKNTTLNGPPTPVQQKSPENNLWRDTLLPIYPSVDCQGKSQLYAYTDHTGTIEEGSSAVKQSKVDDPCSPESWLSSDSIKDSEKNGDEISEFTTVLSLDSSKVHIANECHSFELVQTKAIAGALAAEIIVSSGSSVFQSGEDIQQSDDGGNEGQIRMGASAMLDVMATSDKKDDFNLNDLFEINFDLY